MNQIGVLCVICNWMRVMRVGVLKKIRLEGAIPKVFLYGLCLQLIVYMHLIMYLLHYSQCYSVSQSRWEYYLQQVYELNYVICVLFCDKNVSPTNKS